MWETDSPYQSTLEVAGSSGTPQDAGEQLQQQRGGEVVVRGMSIRHYSKSVANNYAVFLRVRAWG